MCTGACPSRLSAPGLRTVGLQVGAAPHSDSEGEAAADEFVIAPHPFAHEPSLGTGGGSDSCDGLGEQESSVMNLARLELESRYVQQQSTIALLEDRLSALEEDAVRATTQLRAVKATWREGRASLVSVEQREKNLQEQLHALQQANNALTAKLEEAEAARRAAEEEREAMRRKVIEKFGLMEGQVVALASRVKQQIQHVRDLEVRAAQNKEKSGTSWLCC